MLTLNFDPFPIIETPRLILRQPTREDGPELLEMRSDPQVMQYIPRPMAQSLEDIYGLLDLFQEMVARNERINWAMEWRETGKVVGMISYVNFKLQHDRAEVGYSLSRAWHRKGIMMEALCSLLDWGFNTLGLHSAEAIVDAENVASRQLLEKAGFRKEALFLEDFFWNDRYRDSVHYGLLRREWEVLKQISTKYATVQ
jgi:ribosomal-protein-alanine N-acetyltransferase